MSEEEQKLTREAFAKIKACAEGNGIDPSKIELLGSDETSLTVKAQMWLTFDINQQSAVYPGPFKNVKNMPKGRYEKIAAEKDLPAKIKELKTKADHGGYWSKDAARQLNAEPGHGWGIEKADVVIDNLAYVVHFDVPCKACAGTATLPCETCRRTGSMPCTLCRETGFEVCGGCGGSGRNNSNPEQVCSICNGNRQVYCRECMGKRSITCYACRGQGKTKCASCDGKGMSTHEVSIAPIAKAEFHITDSADLPSGFRKAIARAGLKTLTKGHATISVQEMGTKPNGDPFIPYTAIMPYAEMRVKINGKAMRCALLGHKGVILDLPNFLDHALEATIAQFEEQAKQPDTLAKALKLRICREAFGLLQLKNADAKILRHLYPTGLSLEMAGRILNAMRSLVYSQTILARMIAAGVSVLLFAAVDYALIASGVREALATHTKPILALIFDIAVCTGGYFLQDYLLRFVAARKLQRQLNNGEQPTMQSAGGVGIVASIAVIAIYIAMLFILKPLPTWPRVFM
ncbi:MAG: hypothetical protein EB059_04515 [Alphaproteobacteria bacterium]|nr:hypothetical protein [Alphaproteobacteria bacterium]